LSFKLNAAKVGVSKNNIIITGTFTDKNGKAGKKKSCKTNANGQCTIFGKKRKKSKYNGSDDSDFTLVSLKTDKMVYLKMDKILSTPEFEITVTWKERIEE